MVVTERPLVLILDDDATIRLVVGAVIEGDGYSVFSTDQWTEVSTKLRERRGESSILICDLNMPGIRGDEYCSLVQKYYPAVKIILFTGAAPASAKAVASKLGVPLAAKSDGPDVLLDLIRTRKT